MGRELRLSAPFCFCLYDDWYYPETVRFLDQIDAGVDSGSYMLLDFSRVSRITAAAAVALFARVYRVRVLAYRDSRYTDPKRVIRFKLPVDSVVRKAFSSSGLTAVLGPNLASGENCEAEDGLKGFKTGVGKGRFPILRSQLESIFTLAGYQTPPDKLVSAIHEAYLNTGHHAYKGDVPDEIFGRWWHFLRWNESARTVSLVVHDLGCGIRSSLEAASAMIPYGNEDSHYIQYAMQEGVTSTGLKGRGNGSKAFLEPIERSDTSESLMVMSGKGRFIRFKGKFLEVESLEVPLVGTMVEWTFRAI